MTHSIQSRARDSQLTSHRLFGSRTYAGCLLAMLWCGGVSAQGTVSTEANSIDAPPGDTQSTEEISVITQRQTQLNSEALSFSDTPDAEPHVNGISGVAGLGALVGPAYDGSKKTKTSPFPYVDIHGFFNDHLYLSSVRGIGVKLLDLDHFRGGFALNYADGRTSKDDPRAPCSRVGFPPWASRYGCSSDRRAKQHDIDAACRSISHVAADRCGR